MDEKDNMKKSIEKHCLECWDDDKEKVINCPYKSCPLWKYRLEKINEPRKEKNLKPIYKKIEV